MYYSMAISSFLQIILSAAKSAGAKVSFFVWTLFLLSLVGALCSTHSSRVLGHTEQDLVPRESQPRGCVSSCHAALRLGLVAVHLLAHLLLIPNYYISTDTLCRGQELFLRWEICNICKMVGNTFWSCAVAATSCGRALSPFQGTIKQVLCVPFSSGFSKHKSLRPSQSREVKGRFGTAAAGSGLDKHSVQLGLLQPPLALLLWPDFYLEQFTFNNHILLHVNKHTLWVHTLTVSVIAPWPFNRMCSAWMLHSSILA